MSDDPRFVEFEQPPGVMLGEWLDSWDIMKRVDLNGREYRVVLIEDTGRVVLELGTALYSRSFVSAVKASERFPLYRLARSS